MLAVKLKTPCLDCGEVAENTRCPSCSTKYETARNRGRSKAPKASTKQRGYTGAWRRLSERARQLQGFCSDCGATTDLQADHSPEAWRRHEKGLPLRISDIDVVCGDCNRERGAARGQHARSDSKPSKPQGSTRLPEHANRPPQRHTDTGGAPQSALTSDSPAVPPLRAY